MSATGGFTLPGAIVPAVKHQPATPLPFSRMGAMWIEARDEYGAIRYYDPARYESHSVARVFGPDQEQNGDYLVHAANAYPRLVEALRKQLSNVERRLDAVQAAHGIEARAEEAALEIEARALLAELGEAS